MNPALATPSQTPWAPMRAAWLALGLLAATWAAAQNGNIAINTTGAAASPYALLDVSSLSNGIFLPRMAALPAAAGLPNGLVVYKTGAPKGFFVVESNQWVRLQTGPNGWDMFGNYLLNATNPNPDYIGTTDLQPLYIRTNNLHRIRVEGTSGYVAIGYPAATSPVERLDISGALRMYYVPTGGNEASNTNDRGTIRYQTYGSLTGTAPYQVGTNEKLATTTAATTSALLGAAQSYPLQYAGHWGKVDTSSMRQGAVIGTVPPTLIPPKTGGWLALENPYEEVINKPWTHFKDAKCSVANTDADVPSTPAPFWSNAAPVPPGDQEFVSPFFCKAGARKYFRRQYLFRAEELDMERAQVAGLPATMGICAGKPVTQIGFYVNSRWQMPFATPLNEFSVTVRHAQPGVNDLAAGFDNNPDYAGLSCGIATATWPTVGVGSVGWSMVTLSPPFVWDGSSNVIIEVAMGRNGSAGEGASPAATTSEVYCTNATFIATRGATWISTLLPAQLITPPAPIASCNATTNNSTLMVNSYAHANYTSGTSLYRPQVRFFGQVAAVDASAVLSGNGSYITYPGALVVEDTSSKAAGTTIPWGVWRMGFPAGNSYFSYQGNGTISAQRGVFDSGSKLNDHVFDRAFDGRVAPADAAPFGEQRPYTIAEMAQFTSQNRHLPTLKGRNAWNNEGGFSLGDLGNQLWTTTENQALYIADLHDKLNAIEILAGDRPLNATEFLTARNGLAHLPAYTDAEKIRLIADLRKRVITPTQAP